MNEQYSQTLKSVETEDWLDFHVIRPFCFQLARLFAKFDIHPNTVTIWSIIIGAGSLLMAVIITKVGRVCFITSLPSSC